MNTSAVGLMCPCRHSPPVLPLGSLRKASLLSFLTRGARGGTTSAPLNAYVYRSQRELAQEGRCQEHFTTPGGETQRGKEHRGKADQEPVARNRWAASSAS